ncbi:hypothetical protein PENSPDRAFT_200336 [Peniophora sp. CONT]|nr:hypothetical protein PENSPDRAFT_200336 [Peniophora sp. CONT]
MAISFAASAIFLVATSAAPAASNRGTAGGDQSNRGWSGPAYQPLIVSCQLSVGRALIARLQRPKRSSSAAASGSVKTLAQQALVAPSRASAAGPKLRIFRLRVLCNSIRSGVVIRRKGHGGNPDGSGIINVTRPRRGE